MKEDETLLGFRKDRKNMIMATDNSMIEKILSKLSSKKIKLCLLTSKIDSEKEALIEHIITLTKDKPYVLRLNKFNEKSLMLLSKNLDAIVRNERGNKKDLVMLIDIDNLRINGDVQKYLVVRTIAEALEKYPKIKKAIFLSQRKDFKDIIEYFNT